MKKFLLWILAFTILLFSIPMLLYWEMVSAAKVFGVIVVLLFSFSVRFWLYRTNKEFNPLERVKLNLNDRYWMKMDIGGYSEMTIKDKAAYEDRIGIFLACVPIVFSSGEFLTDRRKAINLASTFVDHIGMSAEIKNLLPRGILLENGNQTNRMEGFSQDNFLVLSSRVLDGVPVRYDWSGYLPVSHLDSSSF